MAKGAATEEALGSLHSKIAGVFIKVLERYEKRLIAIDTIDPDTITDDIILQLFDENAMPNPRMLSAVTKFLKDNNIGFDTQQIQELSDQERRLKERSQRRGNIASLTNLKVVGE